MYRQAGSKGAPPEGAAAQEPPPGGDGGAQGDVVDAEFEDLGKKDKK
jgi:hypothetical protein